MNGVVCERGNRCKAYKICHECNRIRQARIADVVELGAATSRISTYAVVRTYAERSLNKDKAKLIKNLKMVSDGGIWTIEKGEKVKGLHVNLIIGNEKGVSARDIARIFPSDADVWAGEVPRGEVRNVAAYVSKLVQIPQKGDYDGNIYGSFGKWKRPLGLLGESKNAVYEALAKEQMLVEAGYGKEQDLQEIDWSETFNLQDLVDKATPVSKKVLNDEIKVKEVYVEGQGLMSKEEIEAGDSERARALLNHRKEMKKLFD
jgi:hypothetical protein